MICLIVGDFCTGKDLVADTLMKINNSKHDCVRFRKILSYTTREPRYKNERTHIFCTKEEFDSFDDIIASTQIGDNFYGARESQFEFDSVNLYCVDDKGVQDIIDADIDDVYVIQVIRPKWLRNCPKDRLNRVRHNESIKYKYDYRIINDGDKRKLEASVNDCFEAIIKMKKSL